MSSVRGIRHFCGIRPLVTKAEYDRWTRELSNWGRCGKDDEAGALNVITPAKRREAAALVKDGIAMPTRKIVDEVNKLDRRALLPEQSAGTGR